MKQENRAAIQNPPIYAHKIYSNEAYFYPKNEFSQVNLYMILLILVTPDNRYKWT